jgi:thiamine phosphate synthase YjbQ (UPF0047 family)
MKSLTEHLWFETPHRRDYVNITDTVEQLVRKSGVQEGLCLVNARHIKTGKALNACSRVSDRKFTGSIDYNSCVL